MRITNQNYSNTKSNVNFKSKISVKIYSNIRAANGSFERQTTVDKNIETIIRKFIRVLN